MVFQAINNKKKYIKKTKPNLENHNMPNVAVATVIYLINGLYFTHIYLYIIYCH